MRKKDWEQLQADRARLIEQLNEWERWRSFLRIAKQLHANIVELLGTEAGAEEIGRLALMKVEAEQAEQARGELVAKYEREHRKTLYAQVLAKVEAEEGPTIMADVFQRIETNPKLVKELHDSARKELIARAKGVAADKVTEEQRLLIDEETERQMALDRLDVAFVREGQLNLQDPTLLELLQPGDRLIVQLRGDRWDTKDGLGLVFNWQGDINEATGWVLGDPVPQPRDRFHPQQSASPIKTWPTPKDRFITLGSQMPDLVNGGAAIKPNIITARYPLAATWTTASGDTADHTICAGPPANGSSFANPDVPLQVTSVDLQTRDLHFGNAA